MKQFPAVPSFAARSVSETSPRLVTWVRTDIPARLDALPWSRWHLRVTVALAITWLLDGLEGSLAGSLTGELKSKTHGLGLTDAHLGASSTCYLAGAVLGALVFGYLADRLGRRRLFFWTLILYLIATAATGLSQGLITFTICRMLTGAGIGGEYAAINSAVDELTPARLRGRTDLWINGTFWLGIMLGSVLSVGLLSVRLPWGLAGWRLAFCSGLPVGLVVLLMRRAIPESPRWLLSQGAVSEAETVVEGIEAAALGGRRMEAVPVREETIVRVHRGSAFARIFGMLTGTYRGRAALCFVLMAAQAFFYNSVFFSMSLVLLQYYGVPAERLGYTFIPIAVTNFLGPVLLGRFFDTIGRRQMICATYVLSGVSLLVSSLLFRSSELTAAGQIAWWAVTFFFASTAASSAYLTVSEVFPQEIRATSIAFFYAFGTLAGGVFGPLVFGHLTSSSSRGPLFMGYAMGAAVMVAAGLAQGLWGVAAEGKGLEAVAHAEAIPDAEAA